MAAGGTADRAGAVVAALAAHFGDLAGELRLLTGPNPPLYPSASAFSFAWEPAHSGETAVASALAQELDLTIGAMTEGVDLQFGPGPVADPAAGATLAELLAAPATMAAHEKAEQGCQALARGWFEEAEQLFVAGARLDPTDPGLRFGAGLAAWRQRSVRAALHFNLASRYLAPTDQAGSAYVAILAAAVQERLGDAAVAHQWLVEAAGRLDHPCPAITLHLARLDPDRRSWGEAALTVDPMVEADLLALGLQPDREVSTEHRFRIEWEINQLERAVAEVRRLDRGAVWPDAAPSRSFGRDVDHLLVAQGEVALAAKVASCRAAVDVARSILEERAAQRRAREAVWQQEADEARFELRHRTVAPVFAACLVLAVAGLVVALGGRLAMRAVPTADSLIAVLAHLVLVGLLAVAGWLFATTWWPHRRYRSARRAGQELPHLRFEAAVLREEEFDLRRRIRRAAHDVETRLARIAERRAAVVPRRPELLMAASSDAASGPAPTPAPASS
ncbi:MAG: hypothetical protein R2761_05235 [Acidimicrobiales bacterium]